MIFLALAAALLPAPGARAADCVAPGSLAASLDQAEAMTPTERAGLDQAAFLTPVIYAHACRAVAGDGDACAQLSGFTVRIPGARSLEWNCRQRQAEAEFSRALVRKDPRAPQVCAAFMRAQMDIKDAAKTRALCAGVVSAGSAGDPDLCRAVLAAEGRDATPMRLRGCAGALKIYRGEVPDCDALKGQDFMAADLALCRAVRGLRSGDCAGEPLCRALNGEGPAACAAYDDEAQKVFAARRTGRDDRAAPPGAEGAPKRSVADDVLPQVPDGVAPKPAAARAPVSQDFPAARRDAYPSFVDGELRLPKLYAEGKDYAAADRPALLDALHAAHHLADVNIAAMEGYQPYAALHDGAEVVLARPARRDAGPTYLRFVVDADSGRLQLVQLGYAPGSAALFAASGAKPRLVDFGPGAGKDSVVDVAVSVYDSAGLFAPSFPDAPRLAASGVRSFFGESVPGPHRPRPLCRP